MKNLLEEIQDINQSVKNIVEGRALSEGNDVELKGTNLFLKGFAVDRNGNSVIKLSFPNGPAFSIQTNKGSEWQKIHNLRGNKAKELSDSDLAVIKKLVVEYLKKFGSAQQKSILKVYGESLNVEAEATPNQIARLKSDWEKVAKEKLEVEEKGNAFYAYGSELACLRLFYHYRHSISKIEAQFSSNLRTWFFRLER
jgi:hypothetical protein